jgi:hypothetical protein
MLAGVVVAGLARTFAPAMGRDVIGAILDSRGAGVTHLEDSKAGAAAWMRGNGLLIIGCYRDSHS